MRSFTFTFTFAFAFTFTFAFAFTFTFTFTFTLHCIHAYITLHTCVILRCVALHCVVLRCIAVHYPTLHCIVLYCITLHCIVYIYILSGYLTVCHGKIHPFLSSVNHLFLWAIVITMAGPVSHHQRLNTNF